MWGKRMPAVSAQKCRAKLKLDLPISSEDLVNCGNVRCVEGGLRGAYGFDAQYFFRYYRTLKILGEKWPWTYFATDEGLFCVYSEMQTHVTYENYTVVSACFYQGKLIFSAPGFGTYLIKDYRKEKIGDVGFVSMAACSDRLFGLANDGDLYVAPVGQIDFSEAFHITPHTKLSAVVTLGKKLYALGDACYVLEPYHADDVDITFRAMCYEIGKVQADSVVTLGSRVVFATENGLRLLQSDKITPIFSSLNNLVSFSGCVACSHGGKYYLSCKRLDGTQEQNDVTLILDVDQEKVVGVLNQGFENMYSLGYTFYAVQNGSLMKINETPQSVYWQRTVDFDRADKKYLDTLVIRTKQDVSVVIQTDNEKRIYRVKGKRALQRIPLAGHGRAFTVTLQAPSAMDVDYVELTAHRYEV